ncbi:MAG: hypothetical protein WA869_12790 [Alloacidobacterium sp.]
MDSGNWHSPFPITPPVWGGEYAPYMIDRYTRIVSSDNPNALQAQVYFTLSTWNPYNVMLMTATIQRAPDTQ